MSFDDTLLEAEEKFEKALEVLKHDFQRVRTGRASPAMVEHVQVEAYGTSVPLNQVAGVSVPEPTQLLIKPWDKGTLKDIERALVAADLGMSPQNDGQVIRLNVPALTEERRKQLAAQAKELVEKCKVAMRNARREAIKDIEHQAKEEKLPEDDVKRATDQVTELLKSYEGQAEEQLKRKTEDILTL